MKSRTRGTPGIGERRENILAAQPHILEQIIVVVEQLDQGAALAAGAFDRGKGADERQDRVELPSSRGGPLARKRDRHDHLHVVGPEGRFRRERAGRYVRLSVI